jgi:hypothetical protein
MKRVLLSFLFLQFFCACNNDNDAKAESDLDAARMFIRYALDGKYYQARQLMLPDSVNEHRMQDTERTYQHTPLNIKTGYRNATIQIYDTREVNDSTRIVTYSNSFMNKKDSLKVVRVGGKWLVDLKFTFKEVLPNEQ